MNQPTDRQTDRQNDRYTHWLLTEELKDGLPARQTLVLEMNRQAGTHRQETGR